jgi:hypothetical protein
MLIIIFFVCCVSSIISVILTSGDEEPKPELDPSPDPASDPSPALAQEDASGLSFSTNAALSAETEFIVPQVKAGIIPVNCVLSDWENDGGCSTVTGKQLQKKRIITEGRNGGQICPGPDSSERKQEINCDVNCEVSGWGGWGACSATCGGGTQSRSRTVTVQPRNNGTVCPSLTDSQVCNSQACVYNAPAPTSSGGYNAPAPASANTEGWIDCEDYDPSCRQYGCERDFEGDCLGTFSGKCADYGLRGPDASGDCYR